MSTVKQISKQLNLQLPYEQITKVANRDFIRKNFTVSSRVTYKAPFEQLEEREGFNHRFVYEEIESLADFIFTNGLPEPFTLDVLPLGRLIIEKGHRRWRAIKLLIEQGRFDQTAEVEFWPNKSDVTELQRMVNQYTSNNHQKPLTPLEQSAVAFDVKNNFGEELSNEKIAAMFGVSRQTIDNLILISQATDDIKNEIKTGAMSFTNAVAFVRASKKKSKSADDAEEDSHKTKATANSLPEDELKDEMKELADLEQRAEEFKERQSAKEARDLELLLDLANEVLVNRESLTPHIGKRLAAPAYGIWNEDFVDPEGGEVVNIERTQLLLAKDQKVNETAIDLLIANNAKSVYIYKVHTAAPSVFTELPETEREKGKYDEDRPEIAQVQNAIKLGDRISVRIEKLEISEGDKKDLADWVKWMQKDLLELRDWVHSNKKQNKIR